MVSAAVSSSAPAVSKPDLKALRQKLMRRRWPLALVWVAFLSGLTTAQVLLSHDQQKAPPQAVLSLEPTPLPLVAGEDPLNRPLVAAPLPGLEETTGEGQLPVIGPDGQTPLRAYAAPFNRADPRPRLSIVLTGIGLQTAPLNEALRRLPGAVVLAFSAHTPGLGKALAAAREGGHEIMLEVPSDRLDASVGDDPGPGALRRALSAGENIQRLHLMMGRGSGYVGFILSPNSWANEDPNLGGALLSEAQKRGLLMITSSDALAGLGQSQGSPVLSRTLALDRELTPEGVEAALAELEQRAREAGQVVAVSPAYPLVLEKLKDWLPGLSHRGIALAPVSALIADQAPPAVPPAASSAAPPAH